MGNIVVFFVLLSLGYVVGRAAERNHFKSIRKRERRYRNILCFSERRPPPDLTLPVNTILVSGNVVIAVDYFKVVAAGLRSLIGGQVHAFETLMERARREAILRMKEEAKRHGAKLIINVKLETASITKGQRQQARCVEVFAYGSALVSAQEK
ncbi:MAG: heavy metal-binding domain-containing protein [Gammaproteobacteria bacterium]